MNSIFSVLPGTAPKIAYTSDTISKFYSWENYFKHIHSSSLVSIKVAPNVCLHFITLPIWQNLNGRCNSSEMINMYKICKMTNFTIHRCFITFCCGSHCF